PPKRLLPLNNTPSSLFLKRYAKSSAIFILLLCLTQTLSHANLSLPPSSLSLTTRSAGKSTTKLLFIVSPSLTQQKPNPTDPPMHKATIFSSLSRPPSQSHCPLLIIYNKF
ncbi:hypothetical protein CFOL_v3_34935, partial [Cephalotus follicularis]